MEMTLRVRPLPFKVGVQGGPLDGEKGFGGENDERNPQKRGFDRVGIGVWNGRMSDSRDSFKQDLVGRRRALSRRLRLYRGPLSALSALWGRGNAGSSLLCVGA